MLNSSVSSVFPSKIIYLFFKSLTSFMNDPFHSPMVQMIPDSLCLAALLKMFSLALYSRAVVADFA